VGKQNFSSSLAYNTGSIFEWNLATSPSETGRGTNLSIASIFTGTIHYYNSNGALASPSTTQGAFTFSGTDLKWTTVPEPASTLAGLLLGAGLLRRRRG